ncbi:5-methylcytosine-specific restriction enzyme B [Frankia sp. AiPs1]|uniref:AAA family ATPase n=1 Tax=Frankia sp. AiPa1 TaxID=573492 RepID=UPI00202AC387|nr:AAA family ATPase [Frankia sp. AiPa1]MCL9760938.1 AAA family ATPase [Frankia sp. AiPa1]
MSQVTQLAVRYLVSARTPVHPSELWLQVWQQYPTVDDEWAAAGNGKTSAEQTLRWTSSELVRAGWLAKTPEGWLATGVGEWSLREYPDAVYWRKEAGRRYADYRRDRDQFDLVEAELAAVPAGYWVRATDLAESADLAVERIVHHLVGSRPEGWFRVLDAGGRLPSDAHATARERALWLGMLEEDGIDIRTGRADALRQLAGADLRAVLGEADGEDDDAALLVTEHARRAWLVRPPSRRDAVRGEWLPDAVCALPVDLLPHLRPGAGRSVVADAVEETFPKRRSDQRLRLVDDIYAFLSRISIGDLVLTNHGSDFYVGEITGSPFYFRNPERPAGALVELRRTVRWHNPRDPFDFADDLSGPLAAAIGVPDQSVIELSDFLPELAGRVPDDDLIPMGAAAISGTFTGTTRGARGPYSDPTMGAARLLNISDDSLEALAARLHVDADWLRRCLRLLRLKPQLIFQGPPGTGKTFVARELAQHLTDQKRENIAFVQFHPAYSYEDFIQGYRPRGEAGGDGTIRFELVSGPLIRLAQTAEEHPDEPFFVIIDEINRGNLAKIFGELYFLLEYRDEVAYLLYRQEDGRPFSLPRNLFILGTMNTADRSISRLDAAIRRRFHFVSFDPAEEPTRSLLRTWLTAQLLDSRPADVLDELNRRLDAKDGFTGPRVGPAYLMRTELYTDGIDAGLDLIWPTQIEPLLEEYFYGDDETDVHGEFGLDALRQTIVTPQPAGA